jgi:hypothetical protein
MQQPMGKTGRGGHVLQIPEAERALAKKHKARVVERDPPEAERHRQAEEGYAEESEAGQ